MIDKDTLFDIVEKAKKYEQLARMQGEIELVCSFCGKSQSAVKKLVAGPGVYICDECIEFCNEIIKEENEEEKRKIR